MANQLRLSFEEEEELISDVQNIDLDPSKRDLNLSPVNEEREEEQQNMDQASRQDIASATSSRPNTFRRATDPITPIATNLLLKPVSTPMGRSRTRSPYSRSHLRSRSNTTLGHAMTRAYSSPLSETVPELHPLPQQIVTSYSRPESPMGTPYGRRASPRRHLDEPFVHSQVDVATPSVPTIEENVELSLPSPSPIIPEDSMPPPSSPFSSLSSYSAFSRPSRRRPSSPLYSVTPRTSSPGARTLHTSSSVPSLSMNLASGSGSNGTVVPLTPTSANGLTSPASRYNESFPMSPAPIGGASGPMSSASSMYSMSMGSSVYSGGSMPSTPTSVRSRSPSISSLDTIPDSPDAEAEAIEQEKIDRMERLDRLEKLRAVMGNREGEETGRRFLGGGASSGKERKRWSVCGAERRGDLEMETIWED